VRLDLATGHGRIAHRRGLVIAMSIENRAAILARAREALDAADLTLAKPRPEGAELPPCESRSERWRREARQQEERFAAERREQQTSLTESEAQRIEQRLTGVVEQQKQFVFDVLAEVVATLRAEYESDFDAFADELGKRLGDLIGELIAEGVGRAERRLAKAFINKSEPSGGVIDLPKFPTRKRA
jgi:DNA anti-recombination protein RmuC